MIDLGSRRLLGYSMADHMRTDLVTDALRMAATARGGVTTGVVFHGDRGCQYMSGDYRQLVSDLGMVQSVGRTGVCWDCDDAGVGVPGGLTLAMSDRCVLALTCRPAGTPTSVAC